VTGCSAGGWCDALCVVALRYTAAQRNGQCTCASFNGEQAAMFADRATIQGLDVEVGLLIIEQISSTSTASTKKKLVLHGWMCTCAVADGDNNSGARMRSQLDVYQRVVHVEAGTRKVCHCVCL
jgi:hypothetical protein